MINPQLETFIRVADAGSFSKAAGEAYITPTAVIKQINLLEASLGVKLFERSHRGLTLTRAGQSLYQDARYMIQYCRDAVTRARNAMQEDGSVIRIGSSPMTPAQLLMELWSRVNERCPDIRFQIVPFDNTPENAREILANLGRNIDVVGGIFDDTMLALRGCAGLELCRGPFHCAVSAQHPLAAKKLLRIEDLYGQNLMMMRRGWSHYVDQLRDELWQHHPQIHIVDFDFYSVDVFNRCERSSDVLLAIRGWANVHPLLRVIPVDWDYGIPYGILHAPNPSPTVQRFLQAVREVAGELYG
ncbi:MAG: LysR family transcriptional regulator [Aristaeellaceae bacterium]